MKMIINNHAQQQDWIVGNMKRTLTGTSAVMEGCWPAWWTGVTIAPLWLPDDSQGCPPTGACIWDTGWNWADTLTALCGWPKEAGANWNKVSEKQVL